MTALLECLNHLPGLRLGTVVHINPMDDDVIGHYAERGATRTVLVSADPDTLPALHRAAKGRAGVSVMEAAVAPQAREAQWQHFNVRELSGLLQPGSGLRALYPRLRVLERTQVVTRTLQSLLEQISPTLNEQGSQNLLVLEAPGMEGALLQGVPSELLSAFGLVLVRGAAAGLFENAGELEGALSGLCERFYRRLNTGQEADSLWPVALMCYDDRSAEQAAAARRIDELLRRIEQLDKACDEQAQALAAGKVQEEKLEQQRLAQAEVLTKARDEQAQTLATGKAQAEKLAQDRLMQIEVLTKARDEQAQTLATSKAQAAKLAQERLAQVEVLTKARDEQAKLAAERLRRMTQLEAELTDITARHGMMREELIKAEAHVELISDLVLWEKVR